MVSDGPDLCISGSKAGLPMAIHVSTLLVAIDTCPHTIRTLGYVSSSLVHCAFKAVLYTALQPRISL